MLVYRDSSSADQHLGKVVHARRVISRRHSLQNGDGTSPQPTERRGSLLAHDGIEIVYERRLVCQLFDKTNVFFQMRGPRMRVRQQHGVEPAWLAAAQAAGARERRCARRAPLDPAEPCGPASAFGDDLLPCDQWLYASANTIVTEVTLYT
ncbi:hypothetical protein MSG28_009935 [Choristoneura fumiferana]|uniref:Uncharacterized protein n=1 Tax=Choristoneura fumiferana TaxID=7141 RepID=A0ACC0JD48_CHOFU|nr:hypothetical protein MSG28_009935 [Choristoneura fumiferana]